MSFTPLDTSTQRERISVSRSGTMGVRRPPTRRHTPAALLCSSPEDGPEAQRPDEGQIIVDSDDNLRDTPDPDVGKMSDPAGMSIVGFKNISPKIRVGFPVEIQLELQNKLRSSSTLERESHHHHHHQVEHERETTNLDFERVNKETESNGTGLLDKVLPIPLCGISSISSRDSSFDLKQKKKSASALFLGSNFESGFMPGAKENINGSMFGNSFRNSLHEFGSRLRDNEEIGHVNRNGNPRRMSWDLLQNMQQIRQQRNEQSSKLYSTLSSGTSSGGEEYVPTHHVTHVDEDDNEQNYNGSRRNSFTQRLRSINSSNNNDEVKKSVITLNSSREHIINFTRQSSYEAQKSIEKSGLQIEEIVEDDKDVESERRHHVYYEHNNNDHEDNEDIQIMSTPDVLHHDNSNSNSLSPSLERSRKLLKMLDETPDLINKMSFRSYFSAETSEKQETKDWEEDDGKEDQMDWETQRQLSFLNDSLSRILDETRSIDNLNFKGETKAKIEAHQNGFSGEPDGLDVNGNLKEVGKIIQVSQTWISSVDHKPAQTVRDNDVVTSISATNDAYKKGPKKVEFCKTEVHFTPDSGRFNIVETDENKPSTAHLFRRKKRNERKSQKEQQQQQQQSLFSSSSSMSSLESTTATTDKCETAYIVEMEVNNESSNEKHREHKIDTNMQTTKVQKNENKSTIEIEDVSNHEHNSLPTLASTIGNVSKGDERSSRFFINLESISNNNNSMSNEEYEDDIRSPSHTILSNYGEMKIQRYLKQLKSPSSREGSSSPLGSPTLQQHPDDGNAEDGHFRFDNILYENGSFVPLATRRSLIEMNNRNRKRLNAAASQSSDNSSTTSTYSLPTSEHHDQYGTLRMGSMEAVVTTTGSRPQITSVDFRYKHDNGLLNGHPLSEEDETSEKLSSDAEYHNLSVKERRERFSSVPSPVMPQFYGTSKSARNTLRHSHVISPTDSHASDLSNRPASSTYISKKPPTPILPVQFANFEKTGAELRERFYAKANGNNSNNIPSIFEASNDSSTKTSSTIKRGEGKSKSIVTIGSYNDSTSNDYANETSSREMVVTTTTIDESGEHDDNLNDEPELSMDHTWKGPIHYENHQKQDSTSNIQSKVAAISARSLTLPKSMRSEPEWVSKAKSRETRVTDWSLIEKQQTATTNRNTEPPWISEIRFRNKPIPNEELKSIPKISVVYPWQRDNSSKESSVERQDAEQSHIVSIIPEPNLNGTPTKEDKSKFGSYDLYSGKSLPPIKSLKSVPEVSIPPSRNKNRNSVEVHSEPEHYISSPQKYYSQGKKKDTVMEEYDLATMSKSSLSHKKVSSSVRATAETASSRASLDEIRREAETLPKKSRKPLQVAQQNKERTARREDAQKVEDKFKTQPKPPKPPHRVTSLTREEANSRDGSMTASPHREVGRTAHRERASDTSATSHTTMSKKSTSRRKPTTEITHESSVSSHAHQHRDLGNHNQPVVHRHPTIQITKLPMRTAKVAVMDGKRVSSSNASSSSKPKSKHQGQYKIGNKLSVSCRLF